MTKKFYMVLDTEYNNGFPYNIAYLIIDRNGNIYENKNYIISDVIASGKISNEKVGKHLGKMIRCGEKFDFVSAVEFRAIVLDDIVTYNAIITGFSIKADINNINKLFKKYCGKGFSVKYWDIGQTMINYYNDNKRYQSYYYKTKSSKQTIYSLESVYKYMSREKNFKQKHTAATDAAMTSYVVIRLFKQHKKF